MATYFTSIKSSSGGARAYARYVTDPLETVASTEAESGTELTADDVDAYVNYALYATSGADLVAGRWLGRQAAAWGLTGRAVDAETLTAVLNHRDPNSGADLDADRVRRTERWAAKHEKWQRARARWEKNPELAEKAKAFDRVVKAAEANGGVVDADLVLSELRHHLTADQLKRVLTQVEEARRTGRSTVAALQGAQRWLRLVPPAEHMSLTPPKDPSRDVIGYDLTLGPTKSVSLLLLDERTRDAVIEAHQRAVDAAFEVLERELTAIRKGAGGATRAATNGLTAAAVEHFTTRPAGQPPMSDPQLHSHVVVSSLVQGADGTWSGVDSRTWMRAKRLVDRHYMATLQAGLTAALGVEWRERETTNLVTGRATTTWEVSLTGDSELDDKLIEAFSRREADMRAEMDEARAEGRRVSRENAWSSTRVEKDEPKMSDCLPQWQRRLAEFGLTKGLAETAMNRVAGSTRAAAWKSLELTSEEVIAGIEAALDGAKNDREYEMILSQQLGLVDRVAVALAAKQASFSRVELTAAVADSIKNAAIRGSMSGEELQGRVDAWLLRQGILVSNVAEEVAVADPTAWTEARFSTSRQLILERDALQTAMRLLEPTGPAVSQETVDRVLEMYRNAEGGAKGALNTEQTELFMQALRSETTSRLTMCTAPAGAGKSYVAAAIAEAWRVEHTTVAGAAAQDMATSLGDGVAGKMFNDAREGRSTTETTGRVFTVALASVAGDSLGKDLVGREADFSGSIDRLLWHLEEGRERLTKNDLVIVDEAGMASTEKLAEVMRHVEASGARLLMFGDPQQIDSPGLAGGLLKYMSDMGLAVEFNTTVRARDEETRATQIAWRTALDRGDERAARETLNHWVSRGEVTVTHGKDAALDAAFETWKRDYEAAKERESVWAARRDALNAQVAAAKTKADRKAAEALLAEHIGQRALLVGDDILTMATTHEDVAILNDRMREYLVERGVLSDSHTVTGRRFKTNDETGEREPVRAADGRDLSETVFSKGMPIRVTKNTDSRELRERIEALQDRIDALEKLAERGKTDVKQARSAVRRIADKMAATELREAREGLNAVQQERTELYAELRALRAQLKDTKVLNGQRGVVEQVHPESGDITIRVREGGDAEKLVRISAQQLHAGEVVPGFAVTVHSAQGATAEKSILVADENTNGNMLYVGVSRAKGEARVVFAGDLNREDPRVEQWENDRRKAEMAGDEFSRPFPAAEKIRGLWQLANCWARSGASEMATHQAQRAGLVLTQADLDRSRTILSAGGGEVSEDAVRAHAEAAAQRRVEAAKRQAVMRAREEGAERFSDLGLRIARDLKRQ